MLSAKPSMFSVTLPRPLTRRTAAFQMAAAGLWLSGCGPLTGSAAQLTVAAYPQIDEVVRRALPSWKALHPGISVDVVSRQYADHHTAMTTALSTAVGLPDVMALEAGYVGRFSHGRGLEDLSAPPFDANTLRSRYVPFAFDQAVNRRGEIVAVPTDIGPGTLLYRDDLLQRAGVDAAQWAGRWEDYVAAGLRIKRQCGAHLLSHAQSLKDIVIRSGLLPGQGLYFDQESRVLVKSARFERAFELALEVRRGGLDARVQAWTNEWAEGFRRGTVATELSGAWMVGQMANWVAPGTKGMWRAAQLPENTYVSYGGTYYALPRLGDARRKTLAWSLVQHLTTDAQLQIQAFRDQDAFPALVSTHGEAFFDEPLPFLGGQPARTLWREAAGRISAIEVHKQNNFADEVVATELDNVLERSKPISRALSDAHRALEKRAYR